MLDVHVQEGGPTTFTHLSHIHISFGSFDQEHWTFNSRSPSGKLLHSEAPKVAITAFACNGSSSIVNRDERNVGHTIISDAGERGRGWSNIVSGIRREKCRGTGS